MQTSEKGRKIASAAVNTSRAVAQTGKAVGKVWDCFYWARINELSVFFIGGAISQAKGVFSQWWSGFQQTQQQTEATEEGEEALGPMRMSEISLNE